ncbi:radical SAM protein [Kitasatospora sp. NPDC088783]|uniref:radical SAM protein n=1 Tax=Kitasatospora sp. NPDC088783 TaxID=3364077 RepID=UPI00381DEA73
MEDAVHLARSRYLITSDRTYRRPDGTPVRLGYLSRRARFFSIDAADCDRLERGDIEAIAAGTLRELERLGAVVDASTDELGEVLDVFRAGSDSVRHRRFTIMPTAYCNMGCSYCGQVHFKSRLAADRAERLTARVEAAMAAEGTEVVSVSWFGGEPLLGYRLITESSRRFLARSRATGVRYYARMATNGSLLTTRKLAQLHDDCGLREMDVTIDGPREVHDRRRVLKNGSTSFDRCVGVLSETAARGLAPELRITVRVNVDTGNEAQVPRLLQDLAAAGFGTPQFSLQFMPVHSWGNDISSVEIGARKYAEQEAGWLRSAQQLGLRFLPLPTATRATTCIATTRSGEVHDPGGKVYSCSEHPLVPGAQDSEVIARTEDLVGAGPRPSGRFDDWYDQVANPSQPCHRCPFLPICGGSCPKLWREGHVPCPSYKFNVQDRMDIAATSRMGCEPPEVAGRADA